MSILSMFRKEQTAVLNRVMVYAFKDYIWAEKRLWPHEIEDFDKLLPYFINGKRVFLVEANGEKGNGEQPPPGPDGELPAPTWKGFKKLELPLKHRDLTPEWLFSGIDWKPQAREVPIQGADTYTQKISIGLAIAVIIFALVILFLILVVAMGG